MNKIIRILAVSSAVLALASCDQKAEFQTSPFVILNSSSISVKEDVGSVKIPVFAYKGNQLGFPRGSATTTVNFEVVDMSAKKGVNYTVEPSNGVLTFNNSTSEDITINITNLEGEFTSDLKFKVVLTAASDGFTLGGIRENTVTIKDNDHPLAALLGSYSGRVIDYWEDAYNATIVVEPLDGSLTEVTIKNLCPYLASAGVPHTVVGVVNESMTRITVEDWQDLGSGIYFVAMSETPGDEQDFMEFEFDAANNTLTNLGYYAAYSNGYYDLVPPGQVFTKQ